MTEREAPSVDGLVIGILGGTGDQGRGLAFRFARAGHPVIIGSRAPERARMVADLLGHHVQGMANRDAAREASVVIAAVPYEGHHDLLASLAPGLAGKIVRKQILTVLGVRGQIQAPQSPLDSKLEHRLLVRAQVDARLLVDQAAKAAKICVRDYFFVTTHGINGARLGPRPPFLSRCLNKRFAGFRGADGR